MNKLFHTSPTPAVGNWHTLADKNHLESQPTILTRNHLEEDKDDRWKNKQLTTSLSIIEHI